MRLTKTTQNGLKGMTFVFGYSVLGLFMYPKQRTKTSMTNGNKNLCVENRGICHILANNSSHFEKSNSLELKLYRCRSFLPTLQDLFILKHYKYKSCDRCISSHIYYNKSYSVGRKLRHLYSFNSCILDCLD